MERYEIVKYLEDFKTRLNELETALNIPKIETLKLELEEKTYKVNFYDDQKKAKEVLQKIKYYNDILREDQDLNNKISDLTVFLELFDAGEDVLNEIKKEIEYIEVNLKDFEIEILLNKEYDDAGVIIELHPGAGGTEAQDWAEMLFRMYTMYSEKKGFKMNVLDYQDGDEAGLKSVTFEVDGEKAYGLLKSEHGVHRLVRISPFDSNARRHTSFCSCSVTPKMTDFEEIEIRPEEIRVDTYRSSGAGGQSVNTTDSAVRITHLETGIVVQCQNERSQIQNKEKALEVLKAKLHQLNEEKRQEKLDQLIDISINSFGGQIRSYVYHPYRMVKDHRTNYEELENSANDVLNGNLDGFINSFLKSKFNVR
jgi:peptide chain release factor 2